MRVAGHSLDTPDPALRFEINGVKGRTGSADDEKNPHYEQSFSFILPDNELEAARSNKQTKSAPMNFDLYEADLLSDKLTAQAKVALSALVGGQAASKDGARGEKTIELFKPGVPAPAKPTKDQILATLSLSWEIQELRPAVSLTQAHPEQGFEEDTLDH